MEKIEKNSYVRLSDGEIRIVETPTILVDNAWSDASMKLMLQGYAFARKDYYKKYSKNIIELVEAKDLVNGYKVDAVYLDGARQYLSTISPYGVRIYAEDIKTVLTHEQIEQNEYKVEVK